MYGASGPGFLFEKSSIFSGSSEIGQTPSKSDLFRVFTTPPPEMTAYPWYFICHLSMRNQREHFDTCIFNGIDVRVTAPTGAPVQPQNLGAKSRRACLKSGWEKALEVTVQVGVSIYR